MCLKVLGNIFRFNFRGIAFFAITVVLAGCSSNTQRFANMFSGNANFTGSNTQETTFAYPKMLSDSVIQSTELPPVEQNKNSWGYENAQYNSQRQGGGSSSDGRIIGTPPRNLEALSRSQMNDTSVFQKNSYIVQSGDTLLSIAKQIGVSVDSLKSANGISNNSIYIGQVLMVPDRHTAVASNAQNYNLLTSTTESSLQSQAASSTKYNKALPLSKTPVPIAPSAKTNRSHIEKNSSKHNHRIGLSSTIIDTGNDHALPPQATGISKMRWPVRGRLLSKFGQKKGIKTNRGVDIAVPEGSSVKAAENGIVIYASDGLKDLGNVVMIRHEGDIVTIYGHNSRLVVSRGQRVRRGDEIAKSGISGNVKTPRVYFEIRKSSLPVDPAQYLEN
ncbi:peptidoglycan DD-metalloendopeptidase family protein [Bartonella sp. B17]